MSAWGVTNFANQVVSNNMLSSPGLNEVEKYFNIKHCDDEILQAFQSEKAVKKFVKYLFSEGEMTEVVPLVQQAASREHERRANMTEETRQIGKEIWMRFSCPSEASQDHPFVVPMTFNITEENSGNFFLCGDLHNNEQCLEDQSQLIHYLASKAPVVLLFEGFPSLEKIDNVFENRDAVTGRPMLRPSLQDVAHNIHAIGWDIKQSAQEILSRIQEQYSYYEKKDELSRVREQRAALQKERFEQAKKLSQKLPIEFSLSALLFDKLPQVFKQFYSLPKMENELKDFNSLYVSSQKNFGGIDNFLLAFFEKTHGAMQSKSIDLDNDYVTYELEAQKSCQALKEKEDELQQFTKDCMNSLRQRFPARTAAMVQTLQGVEQYRASHGIGKGFIVLIAGGMHLQNNRSEPEYDLNPLYEELVKHHEAAILLSEPTYNYTFRG